MSDAASGFRTTALVSRRLCRAWALLLALLTSVVLAPRAVQAQPLRVTATNPLAFGTLSPLLAGSVAPASANAAIFSIQGPINTTIQVLVVTPDQLIGSQQYVSTASWVATVTTQSIVSPTTQPLVAGSEIAVALGSDGLATLRVGATVTPPMTVGSGTFVGSITVVAREPTGGYQSLTAQTTATAVIRQPLVMNVIPMAFGNVYVGTPKTLAPADANAIRTTIDGALGATIEVTLDVLPSTLARDGGGGTLAIGSWGGRTGGTGCTGIAFVATAASVLSLDLTTAVGTGGRIVLCLGATVSPTALQAPGTYSGNVVLSVRYTGA